MAAKFLTVHHTEQVWPVGAKVIVGTDITGTVTGIMLRAGVTYEVVWWDGRTRRCEWLAECEIKPGSEDSTKLRIGFKHDPMEAP